MVQKMIDMKKLSHNIAVYNSNLRDNFTQTTTFDDNSMSVFLSSHKLVNLYYSKAYKDFVLCFSFSNCKKFIITRSMWKILRNHLKQIDGVFMDN
jgi:S-adenosylhomocysteine hydrolase